jgi:hypothetical protein
MRRRALQVVAGKWEDVRPRKSRERAAKSALVLGFPST